MPGSLLLGIDIGTYSSKGVLCTPDGDVLASHNLPRPDHR
jgi:xylulokinase